MRVIVLLILAVVIGACAKAPRDSSPAKTPDDATNSARDLVFLTRDGCVNTTTMRANLDEALRSLGLSTDYQVIDLGTLDDSDPRGGYGPPTVLYKSRDLFGLPEPAPPHPAAT